MLSMGDTNTRLGELNDINEVYNYKNNPGTKVNENGKHIRKLLFNAATAMLVNLLKYENKTFDGGYTFRRNDKMSQIDWCFSNKYGLACFEKFPIERENP